MIGHHPFSDDLLGGWMDVDGKKDKRSGEGCELGMGSGQQLAFESTKAQVNVGAVMVRVVERGCTCRKEIGFK